MNIKERVQQLLHPPEVPREVVIETAAKFAIPHQDLDEFSIEGEVGSIHVKVHYQIVKEKEAQKRRG
jgi:hypothetical protein